MENGKLKKQNLTRKNWQHNEIIISKEFPKAGFVIFLTEFTQHKV